MQSADEKPVGLEELTEKLSRKPPVETPLEETPAVREETELPVVSLEQAASQTVIPAPPPVPQEGAARPLPVLAGLESASAAGTVPAQRTTELSVPVGQRVVPSRWASGYWETILFKEGDSTHELAQRLGLNSALPLFAMYSPEAQRFTVIYNGEAMVALDDGEHGFPDTVALDPSGVEPGVFPEHFAVKTPVSWLGLAVAIEAPTDPRALSPGTPLKITLRPTQERTLFSARILIAGGDPTILTRRRYQAMTALRSVAQERAITLPRPEQQVFGTSNFEEANRQVGQNRPDILIVELSPRNPGSAAALLRNAAAANPRLQMIVVRPPELLSNNLTSLWPAGFPRQSILLLEKRSLSIHVIFDEAKNLIRQLVPPVGLEEHFKVTVSSASQTERFHRVELKREDPETARLAAELGLKLGPIFELIRLEGDNGFFAGYDEEKVVLLPRRGVNEGQAWPKYIADRGDLRFLQNLTISSPTRPIEIYGNPGSNPGDLLQVFIPGVGLEETSFSVPNVTVDTVPHEIVVNMLGGTLNAWGVTSGLDVKGVSEVRLALALGETREQAANLQFSAQSVRTSPEQVQRTVSGQLAAMGIREGRWDLKAVMERDGPALKVNVVLAVNAEWKAFLLQRVTKVLAQWAAGAKSTNKVVMFSPNVVSGYRRPFQRLAEMLNAKRTALRNGDAAKLWKPLYLTEKRGELLGLVPEGHLVDLRPQEVVRFLKDERKRAVYFYSASEKNHGLPANGNGMELSQVITSRVDRSALESLVYAWGEVLGVDEGLIVEEADTIVSYLHSAVGLEEPLTETVSAPVVSGPSARSELVEEQAGVAPGVSTTAAGSVSSYTGVLPPTVGEAGVPGNVSVTTAVPQAKPVLILAPSVFSAALQLSPELHLPDGEFIPVMALVESPEWIPAVHEQAKGAGLKLIRVIALTEFNGNVEAALDFLRRDSLLEGLEPVVARRIADLPGLGEALGVARPETFRRLVEAELHAGLEEYP